jgi:hypothetical protein
MAWTPIARGHDSAEKSGTERYVSPCRRRDHSQSFQARKAAFSKSNTCHVVHPNTALFLDSSQVTGHPENERIETDWQA